MRTSLLPFEQDGIQEILASIIKRTTTDEDLQRIILTLWYIWRARNDTRFKRRKWSVLQVHCAIEADIDVAAACARADPSTENLRGPQGVKQPMNLQQCNSIYAGTNNDGRSARTLGLSSDQNLCRFPMLLIGARCYTDASTAPDTLQPSSRKAGLGIFILDSSRNLKLYIKAQINNITSVIMAEAAAMALAALVSTMLQIEEISYLTDSQLLVNYLNGPDHSNPPHWDVKPFTERFLISVANRRIQVLKVQRNMNATVHILANQAFRSSEYLCNSVNVSCSNASHGSSCPSQLALQCVSCEPFWTIAARCC